MDARGERAVGSIWVQSVHGQVRCPTVLHMPIGLRQAQRAADEEITKGLWQTPIISWRAEQRTRGSMGGGAVSGVEGGPIILQEWCWVLQPSEVHGKDSMSRRGPWPPVYLGGSWRDHTRTAGGLRAAHEIEQGSNLREGSGGSTSCCRDTMRQTKLSKFVNAKGSEKERVRCRWGESEYGREHRRVGGCFNEGGRWEAIKKAVRNARDWVVEQFGTRRIGEALNPGPEGVGIRLLSSGLT